MNIVLSAAYGMGNIGDEAICSMAIRNIRSIHPNAKITVLAWDVFLWKRAHLEGGVRVLPAIYEVSQFRSITFWIGAISAVAAIARCDIYILGGGGLFRNRTYWLRAYLRSMRLAQFFKKKTIILAVGCERITDPVVVKILTCIKRCHAISVRDQESKNRLLELDPSISVEVVNDGVLEWPTCKQNTSSDVILGLNICNINGTSSFDSSMEKFIDRLAVALIDARKTINFSVRCFPSTLQDEKFAESLKEKIAKCEIVKVCTPDEYVSELSHCSGFIGMRMHSLILASRVLGLPILAIPYSQKVCDLFRANLDSLVEIKNLSTETVLSFLQQKSQLKLESLHNQVEWLQQHL